MEIRAEVIEGAKIGEAVDDTYKANNIENSKKLLFLEDDEYARKIQFRCSCHWKILQLIT